MNTGLDDVYAEWDRWRRRYDAAARRREHAHQRMAQAQAAMDACLRRSSLRALADQVAAQLAPRFPGLTVEALGPFAGRAVEIHLVSAQPGAAPVGHLVGRVRLRLDDQDRLHLIESDAHPDSATPARSAFPAAAATLDDIAASLRGRGN